MDYSLIHVSIALFLQDVQWNDLDYMDRNNDFTRNKKEFAKLPEFIENLHSMGMHYVPILDPGISAAEPRGTYPPFDEGLADQVFIKNESGLPLVGRVSFALSQWCE